MYSTHLYIVTELAERGSLYDVLKNKEIRLTYSMKKKFAIDAAKGMLYLHSCVPPIIHRDLKVRQPTNQGTNRRMSTAY